MARLGFYYDMTICSGCKTCQIACNDRNNLPAGVLFREVQVFEGGKFPNPYVYHLSMACNHCQNAKCVSNCPTGALNYAEDGTVQHDKTLCVGCQYCIWSCPYGAPKYFPELGISRKCDSCKELRDQGKNPVCVDACLMRALKFGDLAKLEAEYGPGLVSELPILINDSACEPSILIKAKSVALIG